ncbi:MAG: proton-conducting transporter membrane subunit [Pseudomonadales bacterium]
MNQALLFALALGLPILAAIGVTLARHRPNVREAGLGLCATVFVIGDRVLGDAAGVIAATTVFEVLPGLDIAFAAEPLGILFAGIAATLWIITTVYAIGYLRGNDEPRQTTFFAFAAIAIGSSMGIAFAANLFTLFLCYEALTLATYPLVAMKGDTSARRGARTYLVWLLATSVVGLLPFVVGVFVIAGTLDFRPGGSIPSSVSDDLILWLSLLVAFGIGKAALMPVHRWLPAAMVAPTPVSALLHAVAVVKAGVFCVVKMIVYVFGMDLFSAAETTDWLVYAAGLTVLAASVIALRQDNLKRRLAYSTVSQLSYVIMAAAIATPLAMTGAILHIAAHALGKITLFFAAGAIYTAAPKPRVSELSGFGRRMPITMIAFTIGACGMIGLPPTAGFIGKWYMLSGSLVAGEGFVLLVIFASTLLNAAYFAPVIYHAFFQSEPAPPDHDHGEAPMPILIALSVTAVGSIALFFAPDLPLAIANRITGGLP